MFSKEFIPFLEVKENKIDEIVGVGGVIEKEVYFAYSINFGIRNKSIELNKISVLKRDVFPTKDFKVMGLLVADIQNYKCIINHDFQLI